MVPTRRRLVFPRSNVRSLEVRRTPRNHVLSANDSRPVSKLFADALTQFSKLMHNELQLARAEISRRWSGNDCDWVPRWVLLLISLAVWRWRWRRPSPLRLISIPCRIFD